MRPKEDLGVFAGVKYGCLSMIKEIERDRFGGRQFIVKCSCGTEKTVTYKQLFSQSRCNCKGRSWKYTREYHPPAASRRTKITYKGEEYFFDQLCDMLRIFPETVRSRLKKGWTVEEAFDTPSRNKNDK